MPVGFVNIPTPFSYSKTKYQSYWKHLFVIAKSRLFFDVRWRLNRELLYGGKYYEFHKLYQDKEYREAAGLLVSLLESRIIPSYFWSILLIETIPLLECDEMVLSSTDTFIIMQCLEEKEHLLEMKDKTDIIRLAATRNLARALIYEAQQPKF